MSRFTWFRVFFETMPKQVTLPIVVRFWFFAVFKKLHRSIEESGSGDPSISPTIMFVYDMYVRMCDKPLLRCVLARTRRDVNEIFHSRRHVWIFSSRNVYDKNTFGKKNYCSFVGHAFGAHSYKHLHLHGRMRASTQKPIRRR